VDTGRLKERCGLEPQTNFFPFKKSSKPECRLDLRIYGIQLHNKLETSEFQLLLMDFKTVFNVLVFHGNNGIFRMKIFFSHYFLTVSV
jgi:hypothetical protein